jgi:hypothetical protein
MLAEIDERDAVIQVGPCLARDHDLTTVSRGCDASRLVDVQPDVAVGGYGRLARVDAHPNAERPRLQRPLRLGSGRDGRRCRAEGDEERVALRIHLDSTVCVNRSAQHARCSLSAWA